MTNSDAPYASPLRQRLSAALELAWQAVCWEVKGLLPVDRANMERAILKSAAIGERDFTLLQRRAIQASRGDSAIPIERRQAARFGFDGDRRRR